MLSVRWHTSTAFIERRIYPNNLKILVQSYFKKANTARCSSFLRTGLKALEAALALVALE
jgi:hypothetical protein